MLTKNKIFLQKCKTTAFWQKKHGKNTAFWQNHGIRDYLLSLPITSHTAISYCTRSSAVRIFEISNRIE